MRRFLTFLPVLLLMLNLAACADPPEEPSETSVATTQATEMTLPPETTLSTESIHSEFYIPGVRVESVITYFNEVCLEAEFVNSGNPTKLQKWTSPIYYTIEGSYTPEDYQTLTAFADFLNTISGFPGIHETQNVQEANLSIHFCDSETMISLMGEQFRNMDGCVTFWYAEDVIYDAIICYRTDIDQYVRNSVILEEIYNGLGPIQDTVLREDSIIYSEFSQPQELTEMDKLLLRLLYHPEMLVGMDSDQCEAVIRQLYY